MTVAIKLALQLYSYNHYTHLVYGHRFLPIPNSNGGMPEYS